MFDLGKLKIDVQAKCKEVELAYNELETAQEAGDDAAAKTAQEVFTAKTQEFDALKAKVDQAEAHQARRALSAKVEELAKPADPVAAAVARSGITGVVGGKEDAQPVDHANEMNAHRDAFTSWMQGKDNDLSDMQVKLLQPKSEKVRKVLENSKDSDAKSSVVIPPSLAAKCLGSNFAQAFSYGERFGGKTILSVDNAVTNPSMANYLVPQEYRSQLQMLPFDEPTILNKVTVIPSVTGNVTFPGLLQTDANEFGGVSFSWTQEAASKPETEPIFTQIEIPTWELAGYTEISERALSRSALPLESLLVSIFRPAMNYTLDGVIINGSGNSQPQGIIGAAGIRTVARQTAGAVDDTDLVNLKHLVKPVHRGGAMYALSDSVEQDLELATDTLGRPLFRASTANGPYDRLAGYPYSVATNCPAVGTQGDVIYGNLKWYFLVMEEEITVARSEHYRFRNNVVAFKIFLVVGGRPMQPRAFSMLDDVAS